MVTVHMGYRQKITNLLFNKSGRAVAQRQSEEEETVFDLPACFKCFTGVFNEGTSHRDEKIK